MRIVPSFLAPVVAAVFAVCAMQPSSGQDHSSTNSSNSILFGDVKNKVAAGRLPDYSYAGYRAGEKPLPRLKIVNNVRSFGAKGDGIHDDSEAFLKAIAKTQNGALLVPKGVYKLTTVLDINKSNFELRGEGSDTNGTVLYFAKSLEEVLGKNRWESGHGGLIWVGDRLTSADNAPDGNELPAFSGPKLATIARPAKRGETNLVLTKKPVGIAAGAFVVLSLTEDTTRSLGRHLHNDQDKPGESAPRSSLEWVVQIKSVSGNIIKLAQPLRTDVRMLWNPELRPYLSVREVGVRGIRIRFPDTELKTHFTWLGFNGIFFDKTLNGWAEDIVIENGDNGIGLLDCKFVTLSQTHLVSRNRATNDSVNALRGHHGWKISRSADCLLSDFDIDRLFIHDVTVHRCSGNVIRRGTGLNLNLDHHRDAAFENLFSDINTGLGTRVFSSSGHHSRGPHAGARNTYWNIRSKEGNPPPAPLWSHIQTNLLPALTNQQTKDGPWFEAITIITPADLYSAQLKARLQSK